MGKGRWVGGRHFCLVGGGKVFRCSGLEWIWTWRLSWRCWIGGWRLILGVEFGVEFGVDFSVECSY